MRVAEDVTNGMPAFIRIGPAEITSWLPDGPTAATMAPFETNCCATIWAFDRIELAVTLNELDLHLVLLVRVPALDEELLPVQLVEADRGDRARVRAHRPDGHVAAGGRCRGPERVLWLRDGHRCHDDCRDRGSRGEWKNDSISPHAVSFLPWGNRRIVLRYGLRRQADVTR